MNPKLILHERVEVRQFEEGLRGSWHPGVVVSVSKLSRSVEYDELLSETGNSKLIESIPVTETIEGLHRRFHVSSTHRGRIRPIPPQSEPDSCKSKFSFGLCVDAHFEDAWWEGVIFDCDDESNERVVFFPDEGDERKFNVNDLRVSRVWDEYFDQWKERGVWALVECVKGIEGNAQSSHFIKKAWEHLNSNYKFKKMISEWTVSIHSLWSKYVREVTSELEAESTSGDLNIPSCLIGKQKKSKGLNITELNQKKQPKTFNDQNKSKKQALNTRLRSKTKRCSRIAKSSENSFQEDYTNEVSLLQSRKTRKVKSCKTRNDCTYQNKRKRTQQLVRKNLSLKKSTPIVTYKNKINRHAADISRMVKENPEVSSEQDSQPVSKTRKVSKLKQTKSKLVTRIPIFRRGNISSSRRHPGLHFANSAFTTVRLKDMVSPQKRKRKRRKASIQNDQICIMCSDSGDIICCDHCSTSYHVNCIPFKDVPDGTWFCPLCCCGLCGLRNSNSDNQLFTDVCHQCSRQYHLDCLDKAGEGPLKKFCSKKCFELCQRLHKLLGISYQTSVKGLTWKLVRSTKNDYDSNNTSKIDTGVELSGSLKIMSECFQPIIDPYSKKDLVREVFFNSISRSRRLDFRGFYVMILQKGSTMVSVATISIHGEKVAEMPLIATPFDFRRQGMCRILVQELEKLLIRLGVERLVLPSISQLRETWKSSFQFSEMSDPQRLELLGYPFLCFYGTKMFQKYLINKSRDYGQASKESRANNFRVSQKNQVEAGSGKKLFGAYYTRRKRMEEEMGKENVNEDPNENVSKCKYVYKRRRVLANK